MTLITHKKRICKWKSEGDTNSWIYWKSQPLLSKMSLSQYALAVWGFDSTEIQSMLFCFFLHLRKRVHTCLEQCSISLALHWYQSVSSSMEGVAVRNLSSSGASSYKKLSSSNKFWSSTALGRTWQEDKGYFYLFTQCLEIYIFFYR